MRIAGIADVLKRILLFVSQGRVPLARQLSVFIGGARIGSFAIMRPYKAFIHIIINYIAKKIYYFLQNNFSLDI